MRFRDGSALQSGMGKGGGGKGCGLRKGEGGGFLGRCDVGVGGGVWKEGWVEGIRIVFPKRVL